MLILIEFLKIKYTDRYILLFLYCKANPLMSKSEQTRQFIIGKAATLFNIKGYDSTSLSDVQDATGLTKGAIYGHFTDKNELALAAFGVQCFQYLFRT